MRTTICVSFPRSGHRVVRACLKEYFGDAFDNRALKDGLVPGAYLKTHDPDLSVPYRPELNHVVQYREPTESLASWFSFRCRRGEETDTPGAWRRFARYHVRHWRRFVGKWVLGEPGRAALRLDYADLVETPVETIARVVRSVGGPDHAPDLDRIDAIVRDRDVRRYNYVTDFRYYDERFFARLRRRARAEIEALELSTAAAVP